MSHLQLESRANFRAMADSTPEDWQIIASHQGPFLGKLPERVLDHLQLLQGDYGGFLVDRWTHSLQTATRAARDGRDEEYVVCALLHDIGDALGSYSHPDIAAAILRPFVSDQNLWMIRYHGLFQGYYYFHHVGSDRNLRERFRDHPWYAHAAEFCEKYDQAAFDPDYDTLTLEAFEPMVQRVLAEPRFLAARVERDTGRSPL